MLERALAEYTAAVGPDHPETIALRTELARLHARHAQQPDWWTRRPRRARDRPPSRPPAARAAPGSSRSLPGQRSAEVDVETPADHGAPSRRRRPRGARFPRGTT